MSAKRPAEPDAASILRGFEAEAARIERRTRAAARSSGGATLPRRRAARRALAAAAVSILALTAFPPFRWPVGGPVSSPFFLRLKPDTSRVIELELHRGVDIAAPAGARVLATAPGIVSEAGFDPELGNYVRVRHLLGLESVYGHLSRIDAKPGALILARSLQGLGAVGSTGRSTGPHLHFGLRAGAIALPPGPLVFMHTLRRAILGF